MKKSIILALSILALTLSVGCKKKSENEGSKKAGALKAGAKAELGVEPSINVSVNLDSLRKSSLYGMFKDKISTKKLGDGACGKEIVDTAKSLVVVGYSPNDFKGDDKKDVLVVILKGMDVDKAIACIKKSPKVKMSQEKIAGKTFDVITENDEKVYLFKAGAKAIGIASLEAAKKIVPGKGTLGSGDIDSFIGGKTLSFKTGAVAGEIKSLSGSVDLASGIAVDITATLVDAKKAEMAETQYEQAKKMPGMGELVKKISLSRSGSTLTVKGALSKDDVAGLLKNPMLGMMMK